jgi:MoCo/4Fe-4S cofactor protein with predicted Tat translocation signal
MAKNKKYWVGLEELQENPEFMQNSKNEFAPEQSVDDFLSDTELSKTSTNRRDFLKFLGFSVTAATVAACETPVIHSIPYVNKPEQITPGIPTYYASTYFDGVDYASIMVKTREGRPIHIKGNTEHGLNNGVLNARINSSVLSLYDGQRLQAPMIDGEVGEWSAVDAKVSKALQTVADKGGNISLLMGTNISPSSQRAIDNFKAKYGEDVVNVVSYDPVSLYGIRKANEMTFGKSMIPSYDFSKARTIVSFDADFMNNWLLHTEYVSQYAKNRKPTGDWMSKHFHYETSLSLTGSNADVRVPLKASDEGRALVALHNEIASKTGGSSVSVNTDNLPMNAIKMTADELASNKGRSLVISGSNDPDNQAVVNAINTLLGNYGNTISTTKEIFVSQGNDSDVVALVNDMQQGKVDVLLIGSTINPAYSLPNSDAFREGLSKVGTSVSFALWQDETATLCNVISPDNHYLESWNDFYPATGHYALAQPTIGKLYNTRQYQESILAWTGDTTEYREFIKGVWQEYMAGLGAEGLLFDDFWYNAVRNGSVDVQLPEMVQVPELNMNAVFASARNAAKVKSVEGYEVIMYANTGIGDGAHSTNPWLQEMPDPISKVTWDNYIAMNPADAESMGFNMHLGQELPASTATVTVNGVSETLPVVPQPGQKKGTIGIALGYGRGANEENIGKAAYRTKQYGGYDMDDDGKKIPIGTNAYRFVDVVNGYMNYFVGGATIEAAGGVYPIATTQVQHTIMGRDSVLKETSLAVFENESQDAYNKPHRLVVHEDGEMIKKDVDKIDLWADHPVEGVGHHWGMVIDLSTCIGCSACVTACHSENNVPVVGKDEVRRGRDMHWMRIDRYYSSNMSMEKGEEMGLGAIDTYREMEEPEYANPTTTFMPMMCQHCNHAPCETVCPVAATTHSNEGLNQMTYNRCIGTRYCANNCPFKVRRFNWFNYKAYDKFAEVNPSQDATARLVLNPDVTVRSRGVMEKCTMCIQRIQGGKLEAKMAGKPVQDEQITTACAEACPTNAITFGDRNDEGTRVRKAESDKRHYYALEEIGVRPSVSYKVKVRNTEV